MIDLRARRLAALVAGALFFATPYAAERVARADNTQDAIKLLDQGIAMFKANDLRAAHTVFTKVRDLMPDKANPYRWLGLAEARLGNCAEAIKDIEIFLKRVPVGDPRTVEAITVHDACRDQLAVKTGGLVVESTPPGAEVRLDKEDAKVLGTTPFRNAEIPTGSHVLFLSLKKYEPTQKVFSIGPRETARLDVTLRPEAAPVVASIAAPAPSVLAPVAEPEPPRHSNTGRVVAVVVAGVVVVGVVAVGLGVGLGAGGPAEPILPSVAGR